MENLKVLVTKQTLILVSEIVEVESELGEPDCKLINPCELFKNIEGEYEMRKWPEFTDQKELKIHSDSIFTIVEPSTNQIELYLKAIK
jgi:hypothetical protein